MTDLSDDERAAISAALEAAGQEGIVELCDEIIWRAAGRYYLEMAAGICDALGNRSHVTWPMTQAYDECADAIRKRIEGTTA